VDLHTSLDSLPSRPRSIAIGTFDGVHVGHQQVIRMAVEIAHVAELTGSVLTFDRHPLAALEPDRQPRLLMPAKAKIAMLARLHPDELIVLPFTAEFAALTPERFTRDVVSARLHARVVVVGENFTYGAHGTGTVETLRAAGAELGFRTVVVPLATAGGRPISSTRIRKLLQAGALEEVRDVLGRPPSTHGRVVEGVRRGRVLGFPTANLEVEAGTIFPGRGVYAARALVDGRWYRAAVNIGHNPTFHSRQEEVTTIHIEAFLLGFEGDIYGHEIQVDFLHKIRDEARFADAASLVAQMHHDIAVTRSLDDPAFDEVSLH
jgi:riboflavin kinase/FMN adenylyltransferase